MKRLLKNSAARLLRPGLRGIDSRVSRLEAAVRPREGASGVWRGGLRDGRAIGDDGRPDRELSEKYREELEYWVNAKRHPERVGLDDFDRVFNDWQGIRLAELTRFVGARSEAEFEAWCARQSVVEIGCGPYPCVARAKWKRAVAVDPLADGYQREGLPPTDVHMHEVAFVAGAGERLPLPTGRSDLVICENTLDHVSDPLAVVLEIRRVLRPGGLLWILVDLMEYSDRMHPHSFTEPRLRAVLAEGGFETVRESIRDHHSHPKATGEFRALMCRPGGDIDMASGDQESRERPVVTDAGRTDALKGAGHVSR